MKSLMLCLVVVLSVSVASACPLVSLPSASAVASVQSFGVQAFVPQVQSFAVQSFAVQPVSIQTFAVQGLVVPVQAMAVCGQGCAQRAGIRSRLGGGRSRTLAISRSVSR